MENLEVKVLETGREDAGQRIDAWTAAKLPEMTRSYLRKLLEEGRVMVNQKPVKASYRIQPGDRVEVFIPPPTTLEVVAQEIPLSVVYEDQDIVVIDKPPGLVVHPAAGNYQGTLVNALLAHCDDLSSIGGVARPGIVHRLDKDTSGLLVAAKNDLAHQSLAQQIKERRMSRRYLALVHGTIRENEGRVEAAIGRHATDRKRMAVVKKGGKMAITHYRVLERLPGCSLIEAVLDTGRTHQIRVHLAYLGHPVVGDPTYGQKKPDRGMPGQALHAYRLEFDHPRSGERLRFEAPLPERFSDLLDKLRKGVEIPPPSR
ncbi:MAG: RluA family pseudouridine synthase [Firmicutes bacterium]|nr:RluA family pseudouridine synthase [Bacillota bacterium]